MIPIERPFQGNGRNYFKILRIQILLYVIKERPPSPLYFDWHDHNDVGTYLQMPEGAFNTVFAGRILTLSQRLFLHIQNGPCQRPVVHLKLDRFVRTTARLLYRGGRGERCRRRRPTTLRRRARQNAVRALTGPAEGKRFFEI